jgi:hypothetical protein
VEVDVLVKVLVGELAVLTLVPVEVDVEFWSF